MKYIFLALFLAACASSPKSKAPLAASGEYGVLSGPTGDVIVVPQWHLSAQTNTQASSANLPQADNQRAIYRQLTDWAENGNVKTVIVEGCEGEINDGFQERFNGWTLSDLQRLTPDVLDTTLTHVGLKLKAKVGRKIIVECGDSNALVKKHSLILSDLRGFIGFKVRIEEFTGDIRKRSDYVATVRDLMKMPADSDEIDVLAKLDEQLRSKLKEFNDVLIQRDAVFVAKAKTAAQPAAIIIGAIHVEDLLKQLGQAQIQTVTFTPNGLKGDEAELLAEIQALLDHPAPKRPAKLQPKARPVITSPVPVRETAPATTPAPEPQQ